MHPVSVSTSDSASQLFYVRPSKWVSLTGMSRTETYREIYAGRLQAVKIGRKYFIHASELTEYFSRMNEMA